MNDEKWTIKLNGTNSGLVGNKRGNEINDLDKIASTLGTNKADLLNSDKIKDIHIEKIKVRHGDYIDGIQFSYKVVTNDKTYSIEGNKYGGNGGSLTTINLEADEYIMKIDGKHGTSGHGNVDQLNFWTYILSKKQIKKYGDYNGWNTTLFNLSPATGTAYTCFFGKNTGNSLTSIGMYEGKILSTNPRHQQLEQQIVTLQRQSQEFQSQLNQVKTNNQNLQQQNTRFNNQLEDQGRELEKLRQQNQQLSALFFPGQPYNFNQLKQEITRLERQELAPQVREERVKFEQLITAAKTKAGNSEKTIDLLLEAQKQKEQATENSQKDKLSGKIEAYQSILEGNLTKEELQMLLTKQTELHQLENHLTSLQQNQEQVAQIVQKEFRGFPEPSKK